jgi:hypothetical protein
MSNTEQDTREAFPDDLIRRLKAFRGDFLGDGINPGVRVSELLAALQAREAPQPSDERAPLTQAIDALRAAREAPPEPRTPGARWREEGQPDPHAGKYDGERAALTLGSMTDDELANAVFLHGDTRPSLEDLIAGKAHSPIVYLTAAKERIRWLSRKAAALAREAPPSSGAHSPDPKQ